MLPPCCSPRLPLSSGRVSFVASSLVLSLFFLYLLLLFVFALVVNMLDNTNPACERAWPCHLHQPHQLCMVRSASRVINVWICPAMRRLHVVCSLAFGLCEEWTSVMAQTSPDRAYVAPCKPVSLPMKNKFLAHHVPRADSWSSQRFENDAAQKGDTD